jgi:hypothetical protein
VNEDKRLTRLREKSVAAGLAVAQLDGEVTDAIKDGLSLRKIAEATGYSHEWVRKRVPVDPPY